MRPLSFTRNLGGLRTVYDAIRKGYVAGVTVRQFRKRCGLSSNLSLLVTEFFLATQVHGDEEYILADTLISHTLTQPYSRLLARLYFFALNLNMPGERLNEVHLNPAEMQNKLVRDQLFVKDGFRVQKFDKDGSIEPTVSKFGGFTSHDALRKWVNNYSYIAEQCNFVGTPDGRIETFADTWGPLALRLFFERYAATNPAPDVATLTSSARSRELHKLIGVPESWLNERIAGAAEMFLSDQGYMFLGFEESVAERSAAQRGTAPPPPGGEILRKNTLVQQIIRRGKNRQYLQETYSGECQLSGVKLIMPDGSFSVDCAHIRPLGTPHNGNDEVGNMLSLSPTMHRLFDRGCVRIDPSTLTITLLHGNNLTHLARLLVRGSHKIRPENIEYHASKIINVER
jgi:HNH endonuclease